MKTPKEQRDEREDINNIMRYKERWSKRERGRGREEKEIDREREK